MIDSGFVNYKKIVYNFICLIIYDLEIQEMVTVDLITGFLGAGKTTFIHRYIHYLKKQGISVGIIENEFGDVGVDSELLKDDGCQISDLSGLCMCCVGKYSE